MHLLFLRPFHILVHLPKVGWLLPLFLKWHTVSLHIEIYLSILYVLLAVLLQRKLADRNAHLLLACVLLKHAFFGGVELG